MADEVVELDIDLDDYDPDRSIDLREARNMLRGRGGCSPNIEVVRRWANPARGCRPRGESGPLVVLPAVKVAGALRTMPEWVSAFEKARALAGARPAPVRQLTARQAAAAHRRAEEYLDRHGVRAG